MTDTPDTAHPGEALLLRAVFLSKDKQPEQALALFMELADWRGPPLPKKIRRSAHAGGLWCLSQLQDWPGLDSLARLSIHRYPQSGWPYRYWGEALLRLGKLKKAREMLTRAIELDPAQSDARVLLEMLRRGGEIAPRKVSPWPSRQRAFDSPREVVERYVLRGRPAAPIIGPDTVFMTLGSCFAQNLAARLREAGHKVNSEAIGEEINSTYANRYLLDWIERGPVDGPTSLMDRVYGDAMRQRFRAGFEESDVIVLTLGLAPCFFDAQTGEFAFLPAKSRTSQDFLQSNHVMRTTTVSENIRNLALVLDSIRRLAHRPPRIVLTVSPVPLTGTTEFESAVVADCISKSTLRVACHEVTTGQGEDVLYWPSFEIVRWLGAHFGPEQPPIYGAEDGNTRHVSAWIVELIIDLFLKHHGDAGAAADAAVAAE